MFVKLMPGFAKDGRQVQGKKTGADLIATLLRHAQGKTRAAIQWFISEREPPLLSRLR